MCASFATHAKPAHTIQEIDSILFILNQCFDSMPKNPKERADDNRPLFLCSHPALAPFHSARMHAYALPSLKEGKRVNMTPVKYHGGRNYKISTYRNPRPRLVPVCQRCPLIKPSQAVSSLSFFPSPWLPAASRTLLRAVRLAAGSHSCRAFYNYSLSRSLARAAFPLFPRNYQPTINPQPSRPPTPSPSPSLPSRAERSGGKGSVGAYRRAPCRHPRASRPSHIPSARDPPGACARGCLIPSHSRLRPCPYPLRSDCRGADLLPPRPFRLSLPPVGPLAPQSRGGKSLRRAA